MISILVVCLDSEYECHCPSIVIKILRSLSIIPFTNEVKKSIIPIIKELSPKWIRLLILSSFMMALALILSLIYTALYLFYHQFTQYDHFKFIDEPILCYIDSTFSIHQLRYCQEQYTNSIKFITTL
ncbi:unnamed protein product (macronuclear) [Paramecium tetraurelia]|uniref:Uncharacterized protein n=1 Tax=Paramecium tetraurelia TaxID=5888 RepID=A0DRQ2_PARTE|nr:uncharacterized protein GSPATT00019437001 [Paramecium tetraurelia]CAK85719.1 unnamed protein product [Paramecium tetraurelia]|eukprot:XP_001453116.1 hypothetical protein (macronuclear) [Paramecium tetraurelia strain d4-2]